MRCWAISVSDRLGSSVTVATVEHECQPPVLSSLDPTPAAHPLLKAFLSGGAGGAALVLVGQPFDTVKVITQVRGGSPLAIARGILASDGVRGLYRGMTAPLIGVAPIFALCFWAFEAGKSALASHRGLNTPDALSLPDVALAGAASAIPTTLIMAPGERIKVLLQTSRGGVTSFRGPRDVVRAIGVRGLYRGSAATLLRDASGSAAYFSVYAELQRQQSAASGGVAPWYAPLLSGGLAGIANWLVALPVDTIKSRIQATLPATGAAASTWSIASAIIARDGVRGLWAGLTPVLLRAFPANAACFFVMEQSKKLLDPIM
jgi:solute carrier family 25 carnitine/acylcarnitine transporter 20/29